MSRTASGSFLRLLLLLPGVPRPAAGFAEPNELSARPSRVRLPSPAASSGSGWAAARRKNELGSTTFKERQTDEKAVKRNGPEGAATDAGC